MEPSEIALAAAPGETYRATVSLPGTGGSTFQLKSMTRDGLVTSIGAPVTQWTIGTGDIEVDDDGTTWVPHVFVFSQPRQWGVVRITTAGATTDIAGPPSGTITRADAVRTPDGMRVWARGIGSYRVDGTSLQSEGLEPLILRDGQLLMRPAATSFDGGAHWLAGTTRRWVTGAPGQPATTNIRIGARIATRYDARLFRAAQPPIPDVANGSVVATGAGYVAWSSSAIAVHAGGLEPLPAAFGAMQADTTAMLARANALRADASLPPLVGDAARAQAARNHAAHDKAWNEGHFETAGRAGFTGAGPSQRCAFVGTACNDEVMAYVAGPSDAIDQWVATPFHRPPLLDPRSGIVGPAQSAGAAPTSVMDSGENLHALVGAAGYPQGTYRGPVAFYGENPDPAAACSAGGQPVSYPLGAAVTLSAPGSASMAGVREVGGAPLAGCLLGAVFLPEHPFVAGRTYEATGTWDIGDGARREHVWTFTAQPDAVVPNVTFPPLLIRLPPPPSSTSRDTTKPELGGPLLSPSRFRAATKGASVTANGRGRVSYTLSENASVRFRIERARPGASVRGRCVAPSRANRRARACTRYALLTGSFTHSGRLGRNAFRFSGRVSGKRLAAGRYRMRAVATDPALNASSARRSRSFEIVRR